MAANESQSGPMKVLVTGATGYIGSHVTLLLLDRGHEVRAFVRSREKLHQVFDDATVDQLDVVVGDMLDRFAVREAISGCDAVIHTAGVVGVSRSEGASRNTNVDGARLVIGEAVEAGCDPVIYTSTVATLIPTEEPLLTPGTPLADSPGEYGQTKTEAERFVRSQQNEGAPVTSFLIGGVYGPDQPRLASAMESIVAAASQLMVIPNAGIGIIDVRDLAQLIVAAVEPGRGPRRYMAGGQFITWAEWTDLLSDIIGRPIRSVPMPSKAIRAVAAGLDAAKRVIDFDYPLTYEAAVEMTGTPPNDDSATLEDLRVEYRPLRATLEDSVRWLIEAGHLEIRFAPGVVRDHRRPSGEETEWDEEVDVVVVGFGAAGASAAIEAAEGGADVLVLERFGEGGASARSGGIVYAGGGTPQQRDAGFEDTPDRMYEYLRKECSGAVGDDALREFCERSADDLAWLESHGVQIADNFESAKVVTPVDDDTGLYFSGNERHHSSDGNAAPRGHRVAGVGMTGKDLHDRLAAAAWRRGVEVRTGARTLRLVSENGRVAGVEALILVDTPRARTGQRTWLRTATVAGYAIRGLSGGLRRRMERYEEKHGRRIRIRARRGVVLATGGFAFNKEMLRAHAPSFRGVLPLGTPGDDGSGIRMATDLGAGTRDMDQCGASRFIAPPVGFCTGVLVDAAGQRVCDESLYAATLSRHIAEHGSRAWLIIDANVIHRIRDELKRWPRIRSRSLRTVANGRANAVLFPRVFTPVNLYLNGVHGDTIAELAHRTAIPVAQLEETMRRYNDDARSGAPDAMNKASELVQPLDRPPYRAIPVHLDSFLFPAPTITLGGLDVDNLTQQVRATDGSLIDGLYAVGRCAAGVASRSYVSGLSVADCIFSGRNAGQQLS